MGFETIRPAPQENVCPHGNDAASCSQCAWERRVQEQPALRSAEMLSQKSRFQRSTLESPNCELEIGEKKYRVELIERGDHPDLSHVQNLLVDTFSEAEVDPEEILRAAVEGRTPWGGVELPYRVYAIKDSEGKVVSMLSGGLLDLKDQEGNASGESCFMVGYAVTDKDARQGGLRVKHTFLPLLAPRPMPKPPERNSPLPLESVPILRKDFGIMSAGSEFMRLILRVRQNHIPN